MKQNTRPKISRAGPGSQKLQLPCPLTPIRYAPANPHAPTGPAWPKVSPRGSFTPLGVPTGQVEHRGPRGRRAAEIPELALMSTQRGSMDMYIHMCVGMCIDMCMEMCMDICMDIYIDMCADMCVEIGRNLCIGMSSFIGRC